MKISHETFKWFAICDLFHRDKNRSILTRKFPCLKIIRCEKAFTNKFACGQFASEHSDLPFENHKSLISSNKVKSRTNQLYVFVTKTRCEKYKLISGYSTKILDSFILPKENGQGSSDGTVLERN